MSLLTEKVVRGVKLLFLLGAVGVDVAADVVEVAGTTADVVDTPATAASEKLRTNTSDLAWLAWPPTAAAAAAARCSRTRRMEAAIGGEASRCACAV
jgi:hypothetical protein